VTPTPTPSPTPTRTLTAKEQAQADAIAAVRKYYAVTYALKRKPPSTRLIAAGVSRVALGNEYYSSVDLILSYKKNGWHLTGSSALDAPKFTETTCCSAAAVVNADRQRSRSRYAWIFPVST